jgi:hypothetical protein
MKQIINGKKYDTDTATLLAGWSSHHNPGDFNGSHEELYRTGKGQYFLHGQGGALSQYSRPVAGGSGWGERLELLTPEDAFNWAVDRLSPEKVEELFPGQVEEG